MPRCPLPVEPHPFGPTTCRDDLPSLTEDEQMLVLLRDELYEGSWDDFVGDLQDRLAGRPHVFDIGPASSHLQDTIRQHLRLIERLRELESRDRVDLAACVGPGRRPRT